MSRDDIKITSSLLNDDDFKATKESLIDAAMIDGIVDFRVKALTYMNSSSYENDDKFFYDWLDNVRILHPNSDEAKAGAIAFTDPYGRVFLNMPGATVGEKIRQWEFIYCHECLHQLWNTFKVADKLQQNNIPYIHDLLNIASDCVINDYLRDIRKKDPFPGGVFPELLKKKFDVDYDRKVDTQYTLYLKLIEKQEDILNDEDIKNMVKREFDGKIPVKVNTNSDSDDSMQPPPPPPQKHSPEYIEGWGDAIQDVLDKKEDPLTYKPKKHKGGDYDKGYNDAMSNMKEGLEKGIPISKDGQGGDFKSDLPDIPWDLPEQESNGSGNASDQIDDMDEKEAANSAEQSAEQAESSAKQAQKNAEQVQQSGDSDEASDAQDAANEAKKHAEKAREHAEKAKEAAQNGDKDKAQSEAKAAMDEANKAAQSEIESRGKQGNKNDNNQKSNPNPIDSMTGVQAANDAERSASIARNNANAVRNAANRAKQESHGNAKSLEEMAKNIEEAAKNAEEHAKKSREAANKGDDETARDEAKLAKQYADKTNISSGGSKGKSRKGGGDPQRFGHGSNGQKGIETDEDLNKIKEKNQKLIDKYSKKIAGMFGEFISKCTSSASLKDTGLQIETSKGSSSWNSQLKSSMVSFVKQKVFAKKREYEATYSRVKRGIGPVRMGQPLQRGVRIKKQSMTVNAALYVDRSYSMVNIIDQVFEACYTICNSIKKIFGAERVVDNVAFKIFAFDEHMYELEYGKKIAADNGNMEFEEMVEYISKNTADYMLNIIITDAGFGCNQKSTIKFFESVKGLTIFVTNVDNDSIKDVSKAIPTKFKYILTDKNFTIG